MTPTPSEPQRKNEQIAKQVIQTAYESIQETDVIISITERGLEEAIKSALDTLEREKDADHALNCFGWRQELDTWKSGCKARDARTDL